MLLPRSPKLPGIDFVAEGDGGLRTRTETLKIKLDLLCQNWAKGYIYLRAYLLEFQQM
jgi:hypothetical protein